MNASTALPAPEATGTAVLSITRGVHQGVSLGLSRRTYCIGHASGSDLMLHDAGVAAQHLRLHLDGAHIRVEALGGAIGVHAAGSPAFELAQGHGHRARLPVQVQVGQALLALAAPASHATAVPPWRQRKALLALAPVVLCGAVLAYNQRPGSAPDLSLSLPPTAAAPHHAPDLAQARQWLDNQLQQAGLNGIHAHADAHQLRAEGHYPQGQKAQWAGVQRAFDQRYGQQLVLAGNVSETTASPTPRVRFQAVWFGNNPYVIDGAGRHLYPGAALEDRWMLERIEAGEVVLLRDGERFTFTL